MDSLTFKVFLLVNDIYVHRFECIICSMVISFIPIVFEKQYPFIYILLARPRIFSKISSIFEIPCFRLTYFFFIVACLFSLRLSLRRPRLSVRTRFYLRLRSLFMFWIPKIASFMGKEMHKLLTLKDCKYLDFSRKIHHNLNLW